AHGLAVPVRVTYDRRKGQRRAGKRYAGVYAGLVVFGIYDRCTPALAAEVSLCAAMLGSLDEAKPCWRTGEGSWIPKRCGGSHSAMRPGPGWSSRSSARRLQTPWRGGAW